MRTIYSQAIIGLVALSIISLSTTNGFAEKTYTFAVLPRFFPIVILERFGPLVDYIANEAGIDVEFVMPNNFSNHIAMVRKGKALLSYQNPVVFAKVSGQVKPLAIASKGKDRTRFRGIIIVRSDSGIETIADLKGKSVSVVSLQSAGGYISQKEFLTQNDISVKIDMIASEAEDNKQENVIFDVYSKKSDVGFIRESALHRVDKVIKPDKIKVLAETSWLPNWVFSVHESVPSGVAARIQRVLLNLPMGGKVLKAAELDGFVKPDLKALSNVRKMVLGK